MRPDAGQIDRIASGAAEDRQLQVLIVEDNPADARYIRELLLESRNVSFTVEAVQSLGAALEELRRAAADVILLDLFLPDSSGLSTLEQAVAGAPAVPIVVLTGFDDEALAMQAVRSGAQDYLVKGREDSRTLVRAIRYAIERKRSELALHEEAQVSAALARFGREIIADLGSPELLHRLCRSTAETLRCDFSCTVLFRSELNAYVPVAGHGHTPEEGEALAVLRVPGALLGNLPARLQREEVVTIDAAQLEPELAGLAEHHAIRGLLVAGLRRGDEMIGFQFSGSRKGEASFDARQRRIARGISQIASLALDHSRLLEELAQANRLKSDFLATMSHELRTPLAIIIGYNDLLRDRAFGELTSEQSVALGRIDKSSRELLELVDSTLDIGRLEVSRVALHVEPLNVAELIREAARDLQQRRPPGVSFLCRVVAEIPDFHSDRGKIEAVLKNLLGNAFKFTERGSVEVEARAVRDGIEISVSDTGIGMPPGAQSIIFQPFRQLDASMTRKFGGIGLGLYVVQRLVEALEGAIEVDSRVGCGSTFRVWLPSMKTRRAAGGDSPAPDRAADRERRATRAALPPEGEGVAACA